MCFKRHYYENKKTSHRLFSCYLQDSLNIIARIFLSNAISNMQLIPISSMYSHIIQNKNWSPYNDSQGLFWTLPLSHWPLLHLPSLFISLTWLRFLVHARSLFIAVKAALLYSPLQHFYVLIYHIIYLFILFIVFPKWIKISMTTWTFCLYCFASLYLILYKFFNSIFKFKSIFKFTNIYSFFSN